ncbi:MAG: efflux RND transporter periplasmic adaptor subunit [Rhodospirillaceae bacterium]|nr:efflux RND transporter periplasmic adaptor subunit [Rhodospirillaceae bacterium]
MKILIRSLLALLLVILGAGGGVYFSGDPAKLRAIFASLSRDGDSAASQVTVAEQAGTVPMSPNADTAQNVPSGDPALAHKGAKGEILYYRNPMGLPDISDTPKQDSMGMDYIPVYENELAEADNVIRISLDKVQKLGVTTVAVEEKTLARTVRAVGSVVQDESRETAVTAGFDGWVEKLYAATTADLVEKGQKLLDINSPSLRIVQQNYLIALRQSPELAHVARERLQSQGMTETQIAELENMPTVPRTTGIYASASGVILEKPVIRGAWVEAGDLLYRLIDLRHVWVLADINERDISGIRPGQLATVTFSAFPGVTRPGTVSLIYPDVSTATRTARIRIELDNAELLLRPGMYADVAIATDAAQGLVLTVPESAVLDDGARQTVLVSRGDGLFEPRAVSLGNRGDGYAEVLHGLSLGEEVVVSANFLIDAESNLQAALRSFMSENAKKSASTEGSEP